MELQAVRYAAMISAITFDRAVEVYADFLQRTGQTGDARTKILDFLECEGSEPEHFARSVCIVLVSAEFSKELTTALLWMNSRGLDITCVRMKPFKKDAQLFLDVQQVVPLPEAKEYMIQVRAKEALEREVQRGHSALDQLLHKFWTGC